MKEELWNWARNLEYGAIRIHRPGSEAEVQELVSNSGSVKSLGTRHSFNRIADTTGDLISTERLNRVLKLDASASTVTVEAGIRYGELCRRLDSEGYALRNLASLPHISVAGSCSTATHGSGVSNGCLSASVCGLKFVVADGSVVSLRRGIDHDFEGAVVGLGGIGVITELSLGIERAFTMTQEVFEKLPFLELEANFAEIMSCGYSVSLFTHWTSSAIDQVWVKRRVDGSGSTSVSPADFGAVPARRKLSPLPNGDPENCTEQMGIVGPWYDRLPHFRFGFTPSSGEELQTEYFVPFESAWKALKSIDEIRDRVAPLLQTTEVRTIAGDSLWMSPFRDRPSVAIHFTWKKDWEAVQRLLPTIEGLLAPFGGRPHWGKLSCFCSEQYRELYPALPEFKALLAGYDPCGKFRNSFLDLVLGG